MLRKRHCRTCSLEFDERPGKRGYIDECDSCTAKTFPLAPDPPPKSARAQRARPAQRAYPTCKYCGRDVSIVGAAHRDCLKKLAITCQLAWLHNGVEHASEMPLEERASRHFDERFPPRLSEVSAEDIRSFKKAIRRPLRWYLRQQRRGS
jgi:hypothetical protein